MMRSFLRSVARAFAVTAFALVPMACSDDPDRKPSGHGVIEDVEVVFESSLDPESVTIENVSLSFVRTTGPDEVKVAVRYDAARRAVVVDPLPALWYGADHLLILDGLRDATGASVPRREVRFRTAVNPLKHYRNVVSSFAEASEYHEYYRVDAEGRIAQIDFYESLRSVDGAAFRRSDELLTGYWRYSREGSVTSIVKYLDPGADARWRTADDVAASKTEQHRDARGVLVRQIDYHGSGPAIAGSLELSYGEDGDLARVVEYGHPGPDLAWFTADDVPDRYTVHRYDALGRNDARIHYGEAGPDGTWFTADDRVSSAMTISYDDADAEVGIVSYDAPGPDGEWLTDDLVLRREARTRDADGLEILYEQFVGPGDDGVWFTRDDEVFETEQATYDARGSRREQVRESEFNEVTRTYDVEL